MDLVLESDIDWPDKAVCKPLLWIQSIQSIVLREAQFDHWGCRLYMYAVTIMVFENYRLIIGIGTPNAPAATVTLTLCAKALRTWAFGMARLKA